jgi:hypothetical protein
MDRAIDPILGAVTPIKFWYAHDPLDRKLLHTWDAQDPFE